VDGTTAVATLFSDSGTGNWSYFILDETSGRASDLYDTGVSTADWYINDFYIFQNGGYVMVFGSNQQPDIYTGLLLTKDGSIVRSFDASYDYDGREGKYFWWWTGGENDSVEFNVFNGQTVSTRLFENVGVINTTSRWDHSTQDGCVALVLELYGGHVEEWLAGPGGFARISSRINPSAGYELFVYTFATYAVNLYVEDNLYKRADVVDTSGNVLHSFSFGSGFSSMYYDGPIFYGLGKFQILAYNDAGAYHFYNYDGVTGKAVELALDVDRAKYNGIEVRYDNLYPGHFYNFVPTSILTYVYHSEWDTLFGFDVFTDYFIAVSIFEGMDEYRADALGPQGAIDSFFVDSYNFPSDGTWTAQPLTGGSGSGASVTVTVTGGVPSVYVANGGTNYANEDSVVVKGSVFGLADGTNDLSMRVNWVKRFSFGCGRGSGSDNTTNPIILPAELGTGDMSTITIAPMRGPAGVTTVDHPQMPLNDFGLGAEVDYFDAQALSDQFTYIALYYLDSSTKMYIVDSSGVIVAEQDTVISYVTNFRAQHDVVYVRSWGPDHAWAWAPFYEGSPATFFDLDGRFYSQRSFAGSNESLPNGQSPSNMVLFNPVYFTGPSFAFLSAANGLSADIELPSSGSWYWYSNQDKFVYLYADPVTGIPSVQVWSLTGPTLVATYAADNADSYFGGITISGERIYFRVYYGDHVDCVMLAPDTAPERPLVVSLSPEPNTVWRVANDFSWWNG
jgi:hypothetical protein